MVKKFRNWVGTKRSGYLPSTNQVLTTTVKNYATPFYSYLVLLYFFTFCQIYCPELKLINKYHNLFYQSILFKMIPILHLKRCRNAATKLLLKYRVMFCAILHEWISVK